MTSACIPAGILARKFRQRWIKTALAQRLGVGLLDRGDQPGRAVADDQQRAGQAPVLQIGEEVVPGVGGLAGARRQADERGLAVGGDAPGGQHRLGRGAGVHPEEAGVQEQVIQRDLIQAAPRPRLVLVLDLPADGRHGGLGDRGLVAERVGQGGLHVADRQAADEGRDDQDSRALVLVTWLPNRREANASVVPRSFGRASATGPAVVLTVTSRYPLREPGRASSVSRGPGVTVPAQELGDLGFQGGLHQQLGAEPGDLLQDLRQRPVVSEQLIDVATDTVSRRYSDVARAWVLPSLTWSS